MRRALLATAATAAVGAAGLLYARWEARNYTLRHVTVPRLPNGQPPLTLLHLSDLHMVPGQEDKKRWVRSLRDLNPDVVVVSGDFLSHEQGIGEALDALDPLFDLPGMFVLGSNDYFAPRPINPAKYLYGPSQLQPRRPMLPWTDLVDGLTDAGWTDLTNTRATIKADGREMDVRGVDDPHIGRDNYEDVAGPFAAEADVRIAVTHAPYLRVLDPMAADGADMIVAGHTHGGQLRLPGYGALVTNCDLDTKRSRGLSSHGNSALHVSAGLGTSPYAPFRFACPPEATLITLTS